jgi:phosphohistidine phosphatase SixA
MPVPTRRAVLAGAAATAASVLVASAGEANGTLDAADLVALLRRGGCVVFMRHAITDRSQIDTGRLADRGGQRNLSAEGRKQAKAIGAALRRLQVPVGEVLSSPVFRARDTADLAFGPARVRTAAHLVADDYAEPGSVAGNVAWTAERVRRPSDPARTDVLVGHIVPLALLLGRHVAQAEFPEGALAVFADGGQLRGILDADRLMRAAG